MRVDEASRETGLSCDMIRHYEKMGLIRPRRRKNGHRDYTEDELYLLILIKYLSNLGVSMKDIARAFETGQAGEVMREIGGEIERLTRLKSRIDARIAAARDSLSCFEQCVCGASVRQYEGRARYLLSYEWDPATAAEARRTMGRRAQAPWRGFVTESAINLHTAML